jgi:hypothetical protein
MQRNGKPKNRKPENFGDKSDYGKQLYFATGRGTFADRNEIDRWLNRREGNYVKAYRDHWLIMTPIESLFLSDLINRARIDSRPTKKDKKKTRLSKDGFFRCPARRLQKHWAVQRQDELIRRLVKRGYITTARRGLGGVRWILINHMEIERDVDKAVHGE